MPDTPVDWHDEFGVKLRTPRPGAKQLAAYLEKSWPTEVCLREGTKTTTILLKFPVSSRVLPEALRAAYAHAELSLKDAFDEVVWNPSHRGKRSFWAQLARVGHEAYCAAWIHFVRTMYLDHFHPKANQTLHDWFAELENAKRASLLGNRRETTAERQSLHRAFRRLQRRCREIHELVEKSAAGHALPRDIRRQVWKAIYGERHDHHVLSGIAFDKIPYGKISVLHNAQSWTPKQLAIALLALERSCEYKTIERKLAATRLLRSGRLKTPSVSSQIR